MNFANASTNRRKENQNRRWLERGVSIHSMALNLSTGERFSLSAAQRHERNLLAKFHQSQATKQLYQDLWHDRKAIEAIAAHHLGLSGSSAICTVQPMESWLKGQFNICVLINVQDGDGETRRKIFRCPMPHKVGEQDFSGAVEEKIRAEVAAYVWIEKNCPEIPIPQLHAFGLCADLQVLLVRAVFLPTDAHWLILLCILRSCSLRITDPSQAIFEILLTSSSIVHIYC